MPAVRFLLNGEMRAEDRVAPTMTVIDWLRTVARLTGTKEGCAEGDCGACTIAVRRGGREAARYRAVNSCLMMLPQLDGCEVLTVEGIAGADGALHPVQQALVDADATQCGFCTPGFAMAMFAFREGGEPPRDDLIHEALAGNLCRCTGYRSIVEACRRAADPRQRVEAWPPQRQGWRELESLHYAHRAQSFHAPTSLAELLVLRAQHPDAILLAGGTDLGLRVSKDREALPIAISIGKVDELSDVLGLKDAVEIGGGATYTEALPMIDREFPALGALIRRIGSRQIRNLGTFAGNLATASPIGDTLPSLIALDAEVELRSLAGPRTLRVEEFITGYRTTALEAGEIIAAIYIPYLEDAAKFATYKLSKRFDQDISTIVAAFRLVRDGDLVVELRAAFGGMAEKAKRARALERALVGRPWTQDSLSTVEQLLAQDFSPLNDHRGGAAYRLRAATGLVRRFQLETSRKNRASLPTRLEAL